MRRVLSQLVQRFANVTRDSKIIFRERAAHGSIHVPRTIAPVPFPIHFAQQFQTRPFVDAKTILNTTYIIMVFMKLPLMMIILVKAKMSNVSPSFHVLYHSVLRRKTSLVQRKM